MSTFVAWLISTFVAISLMIVRSLVNIELPIWMLVTAWILNGILFFTMIGSLVFKVEESFGGNSYKASFVVTLIAAIVTLVLVTIYEKIAIPIWILIISGVITFVCFSYLMYIMFDAVCEYRKKHDR